MTIDRLAPALLLAVLLALAACDDGTPKAPPATSTAGPLPPPVEIRQEPEGIGLADPAFEALPGARADFGRLGGTVYRIEVPDDWNGRLLLYMHGFEDLAPEARVTAPDFRRYLVGHGYAWGASSYSSTSLIPGRAADETAALWDYFVQIYGRPQRTYVAGHSMGGAATHIAAERYPDRYDGALGLCGFSGQSTISSFVADFFVAGAFVAGVTQEDYENTAADELIATRIRPALQDPEKHRQFEDILIDLFGGPRLAVREGFALEEETSWRRTTLIVAGRLATNADRVYELGPLSSVSSEEFNARAVRLRPNDAGIQAFQEGNETTGDLQMPLLTIHTTGDWQVPITEQQILRRKVEAAGKGDLLVQRVIRDASHCGFTTAEAETGLEALVGWVEDGIKPEGDDVLVDDLQSLDGRFELAPRPGTSEADAVPGAKDRVTVSGSLTVDGAPFDATWLGAIVRRDGLITPCQYTLPPVDDGGYEITVLADEESTGCGAPGAEILLWTFVNNQRLFSRESVAWPGDGRTVDFDAGFSTAVPEGGAPPATEFAGEVYTDDGERLPPGTRVEAYVGDVRCGVASTRRTGNFSGYILAVVGPDAVAGCDLGATLTIRLDGQLAAETSTNDPSTRGRFLDLTAP